MGEQMGWCNGSDRKEREGLEDKERERVAVRTTMRADGCEGEGGQRTGGGNRLTGRRSEGCHQRRERGESARRSGDGCALPDGLRAT